MRHSSERPVRFQLTFMVWLSQNKRKKRGKFKFLSSVPGWGGHS